MTPVSPTTHRFWRMVPNYFYHFSVICGFKKDYISLYVSSEGLGRRKVYTMNVCTKKVILERFYWSEVGFASLNCKKSLKMIDFYGFFSIFFSHFLHLYTSCEKNRSFLMIYYKKRKSIKSTFLVHIFFFTSLISQKKFKS